MYPLLLFIISLFPLFDLFHLGIPLTHDGSDHVARIANFYQSLIEGNIIPRWAGNLNWGHGHPILMFLYPLPSYVAYVFHFMGFSLVDSTKLVFALAYIASVLTFYLWASRQWNPSAGFIGALVYGFSPYRFVDLYVRGAIGEHMAFVFPPIIFWGLLKLAKGERTGIPGLIVALSVAGLILSHNAISLMFALVTALYVVYLFFFESTKGVTFLVRSLWFIALGLFVSSFFWIPAFFEGKYTLRDIVTKGEFASRFVPWTSFLRSAWNYGGGNEFTKEVGLIGWIAVLASAVVLFRKPASKTVWFFAGSLGVFFLSIFLMTYWSLPIWNSMGILQKFQFPWRFLSITVFVSSVLGAAVLVHIPKKFSIFVILCSLLILVIFTQTMWRAKGYSVQPESFYTGIYEGTTDTGESSPIWSVRFMEKRATNLAEIVMGDADIMVLNRTSTKHEYRVNVRLRSRMIDNTLYFPGWSVFVDGKKLDIFDIIYQDPDYRGLITFWIDPGEHHVIVAFGETKLRRLADLLSLGGFMVLLGTASIGSIIKHKST